MPENRFASLSNEALLAIWIANEYAADEAETLISQLAARIPQHDLLEASRQRQARVADDMFLTRIEIGLTGDDPD